MSDRVPKSTFSLWREGTSLPATGVRIITQGCTRVVLFEDEALAAAWRLLTGTDAETASGQIHGWKYDADIWFHEWGPEIWARVVKTQNAARARLAAGYTAEWAMTQDELARLWGCSVPTVRRFIQALEDEREYTGLKWDSLRLYFEFKQIARPKTTRGQHGIMPYTVSVILEPIPHPSHVPEVFRLTEKFAGQRAFLFGELRHELNHHDSIPAAATPTPGELRHECDRERTHGDSIQPGSSSASTELSRECDHEWNHRESIQPAKPPVAAELRHECDHELNHHDSIPAAEEETHLISSSLRRRVEESIFSSRSTGTDPLDPALYPAEEEAEELLAARGVRTIRPIVDTWPQGRFWAVRWCVWVEFCSHVEDVSAFVFTRVRDAVYGKDGRRDLARTVPAGFLRFLEETVSQRKQRERTSSVLRSRLGPPPPTPGGDPVRTFLVGVRQSSTILHGLVTRRGITLTLSGKTLILATADPALSRKLLPERDVLASIARRQGLSLEIHCDPSKGESRVED